MAKQKYWDGSKWVQVAPSMEEFNDIQQEVTVHLAEDATLAKKGHVQLNDTVTSASKTLAATANAVKTAMDRADAAFQTGNNVKSDTVDALLSVDDSLPVTSGNSWVDVIGVIGQISTGKKWASGSVTTDSLRKIQVNGLAFKPNIILISYPANRTMNIMYNSAWEISRWYVSGAFSNVDPRLSDGFSFSGTTAISSNATYEWIAFE